MRNKKGNFADVFEYIRIALILVISLSIGITVVYKFNQGVQAADSSVIPDQVKTTSANYSTALPKITDVLLPLFFVVILSFSVWSARLINSTPLFIIIGIMISVGLVFSALIAETIWDGWYQQPDIATAMMNMKLTPFLMNNLRYFVLFYCTAVMVSLYSKDTRT